MKFRSTVLAASLAFGALAVAAQASASCSYPKAPDRIPDGTKATKEEMLAGMKTMRAYNDLVAKYTECLQADHDEALAKIDPRYGSQILSDSGLEPAELAIAALDAAPACPWVRQRRYERIVLSKTLTGTLSSSWGKSTISIRELSLGGGMGTKEDNLRIGSEANLDISVGVRHVKAQVLLRRARANEVGFEIVNTDLESRFRLRRVLIEAVDRAPEGKSSEWDGKRKV